MKPQMDELLSLVVDTKALLEEPKKKESAPIFEMKLATPASPPLAKEPELDVMQKVIEKSTPRLQINPFSTPITLLYSDPNTRFFWQKVACAITQAVAGATVVEIEPHYRPSKETTFLLVSIEDLPSLPFLCGQTLVPHKITSNILPLHSFATYEENRELKIELWNLIKNHLPASLQSS